MSVPVENIHFDCFRAPHRRAMSAAAAAPTSTPAAANARLLRLKGLGVTLVHTCGSAGRRTPETTASAKAGSTKEAACTAVV